VIEPLQINEDIYKFIENIPLDRDKIKDLVEYVHYKALLDLFTVILENNTNANLEFLLSDYVEIISKLEMIINNISQQYPTNIK